MIRLVLASALVFLLPSLVYFACVALMSDPPSTLGGRSRPLSEHLETAPLGLLFALGLLGFLLTLLAFVSLQETEGRPSAPIIYKEDPAWKVKPK